MNRYLALTEQEKQEMASNNVRLPNRFYGDGDFFQYEKEHLFKRSWVAVGVGSEIPNRGDAKLLNVAGVPIIVVRNSEGKISAFHNVCAHRGMQLLDTPCSKKKILVCPYRAWGYGLDGNLVATPNIGGNGQHQLEGFDKSYYGLRSVQVEMWLDVIFVNLPGTAKPLQKSLEPLNTRWGHFDFSQKCHAGIEDGIICEELQANWKVVAEHFNDTSRLPIVHRLSLQAYSPLDARYYFHEPNHYIGMGSEIYAPDRGEPMPQFPGLSEDQVKGVEYCYLFPNLCLGLSATHMMINVIEPISHNLTKMNLHIYFPSSESLDKKYQSQRQAMVREFTQVLAEDFDIAIRLQLERASPAFDGGYFSPKADGTVRQLHDSFAQEL